VSASYPLLVAVTGAAEARLVAAVESQPELAVVRRCVDLAEVLALAATGRAAAALVSLDLRRLDRDAVARLRADRVAVVAVVTEAQQPRAQALGITATVADDADGASLLAAVVAATESPVPPPVWGNADPASELDRRDSAFDRRPETAPPARPAPARGRLIAVWGPPGAPGRTTVAVSLAAELAAAGHWTLLADADSYAASIAQVLGVLDEAPGLAAACRAAAAGSLDRLGLARLAPLVSANLRILTGISRADRWPEPSKRSGRWPGRCAGGLSPTSPRAWNAMRSSVTTPPPHAATPPPWPPWNAPIGSWWWVPPIRSGCSAWCVGWVSCVRSSTVS
jgi:hypothetical protein